MEHNYENGKCTNCSEFIPLEGIGFTNTFGYNIWIQIKSYQTDSTGENLESIEFRADDYSGRGLGICTCGFRLNQTYLENILVRTIDQKIYTTSKRAIVEQSNQQIILDDFNRGDFIGYPTVTIFERKVFNGKIIVELDCKDDINGYYIPLDMINFDTLKEVDRKEKVDI